MGGRKMNNVCLTGRCAQAPLKFYTQTTQRPVVKFAMAFDSRLKKEDGTKETSFIDCECWDSLAEMLYDNVMAGDRLGITGHLQQARFTRKDGSKGSSIKIVVSSMDFFEKKREEKVEDELPPAESAVSPSEEIGDEELPF